MSKIASFLVIIFSQFWLIGCAPMISGIRGSYNSVEVELASKSASGQFFLVSSDNKVLDTAFAKDGKIVFKLPQAQYPSQRGELHIVDHQNKPVLIGGAQQSQFSNEVWSSYVARFSEKASVLEKISKTKRDISNAQESLSRSKDWLHSNGDVFDKRSGICKQPYYGPPPTAACNFSEREQKATAMCAAVMGGCEAAQHYVKQSSMQQFLSSQACGVLVAELTEERYEFEDVLSTFAVDLAANAASEMLKSDSVLTNVLGVAVGVGVIAKKIDEFNQCVSKAGQKCASLYSDWEEKPKKAYKLCEENERNVSRLPMEILENKERLNALSEELSELTQGLDTIRAKQINIYP